MIRPKSGQSVMDYPWSSVAGGWSSIWTGER